jgi:dihydroflavonol-4-reductase
MRLFLTGATGYIGRQLALRLAAEGHEVRALVRAGSRTEGLRGVPGIALFVGDVTDRSSLREGMSGADWAVHAAADLDAASPLERMRAVNVLGSENVASLAYKLGIGRFLSVSSMAYFGGSPADGRPADESAAPQLPYPSPYSATKHEGEEAIRGWARRGLRLNTVYPSLVYGPPGKKEGANSVLRSLYEGRFPFLVGSDRKTSWIYIDDLIDGLLRVMAVAPAGRDFLMAGDIATPRELAHRIAALGGARPPRLELPIGLARAAFRLAGPILRLRGRRPPLGDDQLASLGRHWAFDDRRARTELGWQPRPLAEGLPPAIAFLAAS